MNTTLCLTALCIIMGAIILLLCIKIFLMKKAAREIRQSFQEKLDTDTNTQIDLSSRDKDLCALADSINTSLNNLRSQRHRYEQGNTELRTAITNISHDLRTPLTAIFGYLELLEKETLSETASKQLRIIRERSEVLKNLTEELFGYSILESGEKDPVMEPVNINQVLEESIAAFYTSLKEHRITPQITMPDEPVIRMLDRSYLSRIFSNLLNNAIKYSDGDLSILLTENGTITIANSASSLSHIEVGKLFDRFYTVEAARNSTGLGLPIVRILVERMNGTIQAAYENGKLMITISSFHAATCESCHKKFLTTDKYN